MSKSVMVENYLRPTFCQNCKFIILFCQILIFRYKYIDKMMKKTKHFDKLPLSLMSKSVMVENCLRPISCSCTCSTFCLFLLLLAVTKFSFWLLLLLFDDFLFCSETPPCVSSTSGESK